jgi:hypothetical protein
VKHVEGSRNTLRGSVGLNFLLIVFVVIIIGLVVDRGLFPRITGKERCATQYHQKSQHEGQNFSSHLFLLLFFDAILYHTNICAVKKNPHKKQRLGSK